MSSRHLPLPSHLAAAAAVLLLAVAALPAAAYPGCSDGTPAISVPQTLWEGLQPAAVKPFADTTHYNGHQVPCQCQLGNSPLWAAVDVEDGVLFAAYSNGLNLFTLGDPANPKKAGVADVRTGAFPKPITWHSELRDFLYHVDAPRGRSDVAVVAGLSQAGLTVFKTGNPSSPVATYQDSGGQEPGKQFTGVYAAEVGSRLFAFAGVSQGNPGLHVYDLDAAVAANGCSENSFTSIKCNGVLRAPIDTAAVGYLSGIELGGGKHLLITSATGSSKGLKVWEIVPSASFGYQATQRVSAFGDQTLFGVATWTQGSKAYVAVRTASAAQIYDISSCLGGSCGSLAGKEVGPALQLGFLSGWQSITFSRAGNRDSGTPHLYFGNDGKCHNGRKKEWLYDVSNPASPVEVTGNKTTVVTASDGHQQTVDYWSYSYSRNPSGFSQVMPRMGKFLGDYFYRAAWTIMEAHRRVNVEPGISVSGPALGYPSSAQTFTAQASNCTPTAGWNWSAGSGATITGTGSSVSIAWSSQGSKTVTASNAGCGNAVGTQAVTVLDPKPAIGNVTASLTSAYVCQPITFTATGVTGQPPLVRSWRVEPAGGGTAIALGSTSDTATWTPPSSTAPGTYDGILQVSGTGAPAEESAAVTLLALPQLPAAGSFAPTNDAFPASTVQFHVNVSGATEWAWDFDGDNIFEPWTSNPTSGPNPQFTYNEAHVNARCGGNLPCTFPVSVKVRNCVAGEVLSSVLNVVVHEINPLGVKSFVPQCSFGTCGFSVGDPVTFALDASGDPDEYHFDWDGNGTFEDKRTTSPGSMVTHTYGVAGTYTAVVKLVRGNQTSDAVPASKAVIVVQVTSPPPPPPPPPTKSIAVSGPASGSIGQALTYSASASGCTASSNGWTWSTGGGVGASTTSSITLTFATAGAKTVTAFNSGCSGVSGSRTTTIGGSTAQTLTANFTFAPALPKEGQKVSFDGTGSTGDPQFFYWKIEGQTIAGNKLDHTFTAPGSYAVTLEVSKQSTSCSLGMCTSTLTKTVNVQPDTTAPPPPPPSLGNGCTGAAAADSSLLCLVGGRFQIHVDWIDQHNAFATGVGHSVRSAATADTTGFFWFFNQDNIELLVKMLDGGVVNGYYWLFYGGLSNVEYEITVVDTVTGLSKSYRNLAGTIGGYGDSAAFPSTTGSAAASAASTTASPAASAIRPQQVTAKLHVGGDGEGGAAGDKLHLLDGRFEVTVDFLNQHAGDAHGFGRAVAGTNNAGYFWFFTQDNLELVVKMIDARLFDGHFWVFWTGLSDVKYNIEVKDVVTGETWEFHNPAGMIGGGADLNAFGG